MEFTMPGMDFYFDYRSPYAYLAHSQLRKLGADISYHPFDIRAVMEMVGNVPTSVICKPKNRYIQADLRRWVEHYGVPFQRHPRMLELDPRRLLRATLLAADRDPVGGLVTALFDALWAVPEPLETPADIARIMRRVGIEALPLEQDMDLSLWEAALERSTTEAAERGVFGAPCMFIGDDMFFGNDRLDFVRARLKEAA
jgi:2-hydroxychromene-2-carboxylate isomerase